MSKLPDISAEFSFLSSQSGWRGMFRKYLSAGILIVAAGLACLGIWFVSRLHQTLEAEVGHRAGVVLEATLTPYAPNFAAGFLPPHIRDRLDAHFHEVSASLGVFDMIVWDPAGRVIYAVRRDMTGQSFPVGPHFEKALSGEISVEIEDEFHAEVSSAPAMDGNKFFEIYVPIRLLSGNRIVAVAEYYQDAAFASRILLNIRWQMWAAICIVGIFFTIILYLLLRRGDAQIRQDARVLHDQQESRLRQLNADIHDGIGQLLTVALLRMKPAGNHDASDDARAVQTILEEAMSEVQALLTGTSPAQPFDLPLAQAVGAVVNDHMRRTGTDVDLRMEADLAEPSLPVKIALCRFLREGLHNAFKHAGGADQRVALRTADGGRLEVSVSDAGGGLAVVPGPDLRKPMGLDHLRRRIEQLGGTLTLVRHDTMGMRLSASFPLAQAETPDARHHRSDRR